MQKVDWIIGGVGLFAVLATTLGVVFYDEAAGEVTVSYQEITDEGAFSESISMAAGPRDLTFQLPDNATAVTFTVDVTWTGQAINPSGGSVEVVLVGPNGTETRPRSAGITASPGASSGGIDAPIELTLRFAEVPEDQSSGADVTRAWEEPVTVRITITDPSEPLPVASYSYQVSVTGDLSRFQEAPPDIPDPRGAQ